MTDEEREPLAPLARYLGSVLRDLREKSKLTQKELGQKLGFSAEKVSKIENGNVGVEFGTLLSLLDVFRIGESTLIKLLRLKRDADDLTD